jgi:hypothetical protein
MRNYKQMPSSDFHNLAVKIPVRGMIKEIAEEGDCDQVTYPELRVKVARRVRKHVEPNAGIENFIDLADDIIKYKSVYRDIIIDTRNIVRIED